MYIVRIEQFSLGVHTSKPSRIFSPQNLSPPSRLASTSKSANKKETQIIWYLLLSRRAADKFQTWAVCVFALMVGIFRYLHDAWQQNTTFDQKAMRISLFIFFNSLFKIHKIKSFISNVLLVLLNLRYIALCLFLCLVHPSITSIKVLT